MPASQNEDLNKRNAQWKRNLSLHLNVSAIPVDEKVVHEENFREEREAIPSLKIVRSRK